MIGYQLIAYVIFWFMIVRIWFRYGRTIPLFFIALWFVVIYRTPAVLGPQGFPILICIFAIVLVLIDRFKSVRWNAM
jgi:hypothetical protein